MRPELIPLIIVLILLPIGISAALFAQPKSEKESDDSNLTAEEIEEFKQPKVEDPESMVKAFDSIWNWAREYGIPSSELKLTYKENPENIFARFHLLNVNLTNEEIESFQGRKLLDRLFEGLFAAKLWLSGTRGSLNVFRPVEGGTCIDALILTDRKKEKEFLVLKRKIQKLEKLVPPMDLNRPPDFIDTIVDSYLTVGRLLREWIKGKRSNLSKKDEKSVPELASRR